MSFPAFCEMYDRVEEDRLRLAAEDSLVLRASVWADKRGYEKLTEGLGFVPASPFAEAASKSGPQEASEAQKKSFLSKHHLI